MHLIKDMRLYFVAHANRHCFDLKGLCHYFSHANLIKLNGGFCLNHYTNKHTRTITEEKVAKIDVLRKANRESERERRAVSINMAVTEGLHADGWFSPLHPVHTVLMCWCCLCL